MKTEILLDHEPVADGGWLVRALLTVEGEARAEENRVPLNLSIVLDRSGSMGGDKIEYARAAAAKLVDEYALGKDKGKEKHKKPKSEASKVGLSLGQRLASDTPGQRQNGENGQGHDPKGIEGDSHPPPPFSRISRFLRARETSRASSSAS